MPQETTEDSIESFNNKLECAFAGIGEEVGKLVRCLVQQEIASHTLRIEQLATILTGSICTDLNQTN
jgi:hypothetical protein